MSRAILIPVDGDPQVIDINLRNDASFRGAYLDGAWVENVHVNYDVTTFLDIGQREIAMLVDEEGLVKGLPLNKTATPFYVSNPRDGVICGPAILVGQFEDIEGWDWTELPISVTVDKIKAAGDWAMKQAKVEWA